MLQKYALVLALVLNRISIMSSINFYYHYQKKNNNEKQLKSLRSLEQTMNDLKTITVNRQLAGHQFKTKKQRELAQIGMKYEQLEANEENTLALAKEWANTLYKQVEVSLFSFFHYFCY